MTRNQIKFFDALARDCCVDLVMSNSWVKFKWGQTQLEFNNEELLDLTRIESLVCNAFASTEVKRARGIL